MNDLYVIHKIHDHRGHDGAYEYLVEWKDWHNPDDYTWEPQSNFMDTAIIRKYWKKVNDS
jgi:hypothetical protein